LRPRLTTGLPFSLAHTRMRMPCYEVRLGHLFLLGEGRLRWPPFYLAPNPRNTHLGPPRLYPSPPPFLAYQAHFPGVPCRQLPIERILSTPLISISGQGISLSHKGPRGDSSTAISTVARHSQAILGPLLGIVQDMYLNNTHKDREAFCEVREQGVQGG
jgi:hypothetical protein